MLHLTQLLKAKEIFQDSELNQYVNQYQAQANTGDVAKVFQHKKVDL